MVLPGFGVLFLAGRAAALCARDDDRGGRRLWPSGVASPYRWHGLVAYRNPWADPYNTGSAHSIAGLRSDAVSGLAFGLGASVAENCSILPGPLPNFLFAVLPRSWVSPAWC